MVLAVAERDRPEAFAHAPVRDHAPGEMRGLVQVILGAGAVFVKNELLGRTPAKQEQQPRLQFALADVQPVLFRKQLRGAKRAPPRND